MKLASLAMKYARESAILGRFTRVRRFVGDPTQLLQNVEPQIPRKARNLQVHPCTCQPQYCIFMQYCGWRSSVLCAIVALAGLSFLRKAGCPQGRFRFCGLFVCVHWCSLPYLRLRNAS